MKKQYKKAMLIFLCGIVPVMLEAQTNYTASWTTTLLSTGAPGANGVTYFLKATNPAGANLTGPVTFTVTFPAGTNASSIVDVGGTANCGTAGNITNATKSKITITTSSATSVTFSYSPLITAGNIFYIELSNIVNPAAGTYTNLTMTAINSTGGTTTFNNSNYVIASVVNLVPNPSFETCAIPVANICTGHAFAFYCTTFGSNFGGNCYFHAGCIGWHSPSAGTSDYFNANSTNTGTGVPINFASQSPGQSARTGNAYAGIILNSPPSWREYLQARLITPLVAGTCYTVSMYVNLAEQNTVATDRLGIYLSTTQPTSAGSYTLGVTPQIENPAGNYLTDKINWTLISGQYTALGGEEWITIGNFYDDSGTSTVAVAGNGIPINSSCYYFIEDVSVNPCSVLNTTVSSTNISCNGQCTGTGTATPTGGTSPYTYFWNTSPVQTTQTTTGLCAGSYTVTVTDAAAGTAIDTITITQPPALGTTGYSSTPDICGSGNGSVTTNNAGGVPPYSYNWNPSGQTTQTATGLSAGNYTAAVTDASGCTTLNTVSITATGIPTVTTSSTPQTCTQGGTATANASGGTAPYTYQWCNGATTSATSGLSAVSCTVIVTDASGCTTLDTVNITAIGVPSVTTSSTPQTCTQGGTATANASGGTAPYTYQWCNGQTASTATGLSAGSCTVMVTDALGCTSTSTVTVTASGNIPSLSASSTPASCNSNDGTASANASGGTSPYTYLWTPSGQITSAATGLNAGTYTIIITDAAGCTQASVVVIAQIGGPTATATATTTSLTQGQTATLTANGGGTYQWSNGSTQNSISVSPSATTVYCVTVTDAGNCTDTACVTVTVEIEPIPCGEIFVPNVFSPNSDGKNELECVLGGCIQTLTFTIYDRWGEKVFETTDQKICWDGTYKGKLMNTAVFVYYMKVTFITGDETIRKGNVSLIR